MFESVFHACVPDTATLMSSNMFGPPGNQILVDTWKGVIGGLSYTGAVTRDKCYPVSLTYQGTFGDIYTEVDRKVFGVTDSLKSRRDLNIPRSCRDEPRECCLPPKFEGSISNIGNAYNKEQRSNVVSHVTGKIYYDADLNMLTLITHEPDTPTQITTSINDFNAELEYRISPDGSCQVNSRNDVPLDTCFRVDANRRFSYISSRYLGGPFGQMKVHTWRKGDIAYQLTEDCVPISRTQISDDGQTQSDSSFYFINIDLTITNSSIFNIPSNCPRIPKIHVIDGLPKPCCPPEAFSGIISGQGARDNANTNEYRDFAFNAVLHVDYDRQRNAVIVGDPATDGHRTVIDYRRGVRYTMTNDGANCTHRQIFRPVRHCITDDATYLGAASFGPPENKVIVDTWKYTVYGMTFIESVTRDGCYPVTYTTQGIFDQTNREVVSQLTNFTLGVPDKSVFNVSRSCRAAPPKCCLPPQITATLANIGDNFNKVSRTNSIVDTIGIFYMDTVNEFIRTTVGNRTEIQDYGQQRNYVITNGVCTGFPMNTSMVKCIPDNARFRGDRYFGTPENQYQFNRWTFRIQHVRMELIVQKDNCMPLMETIYGANRNASFESELYFLNPQPFINDTSVFTIPTGCTVTG